MSALSSAAPAGTGSMPVGLSLHAARAAATETTATRETLRNPLGIWHLFRVNRPRGGRLKCVGKDRRDAWRCRHAEVTRVSLFRVHPRYRRQLSPAEITRPV